MADIQYHLDELRVVHDASDPRRVVPDYDCAGWRVLDVGCGIGQTLTAPEFALCSERHGIDVDEAAIAYGRGLFPELKLQARSAESTGYAEETFDLVFSRVALPYTNVPVALQEFRRILKPRGHLWLTLHTWAMERRAAMGAARSVNLRRLVDRGYVSLNSLLLGTTGRCIPRPWNGTFESVQSPASFPKVLHASGFTDVAIRKASHLIATARRA
jgi:SAM-dependent methyltransferase